MLSAVSEEHNSNGSQDLSFLVKLAANAQTAALQDAVETAKTIDSNYLRAFAEILFKANAELLRDGHPGGSYHRSAIALIDSLQQRNEGRALGQLACFSWSGIGKSPISLQCIEAAVQTGDLDEVYGDAFHMSISDHPPEKERGAREYSAHVLLRLAEIGYQKAFFDAGEILRDGIGTAIDAKQAANWFRKHALTRSMAAHTALHRVPEAFEEWAKLIDTTHLDPEAWRDFCLRQAEVTRNARAQLFVLIPGEEIECLLQEGESRSVEYKEMAKWDTENVRDVAGFLNSEGGYLLVGVAADKTPVGLSQSLAAVNVANEDGYERHMLQKLNSNLIGFHSPDVYVRFYPFAQGRVCVIRITRSSRPVYVREENDKGFYVRTGNFKRKLPTSEVYDYIKTRWPDL
jgi:hypothetical protein